MSKQTKFKRKRYLATAIFLAAGTQHGEAPPMITGLSSSKASRNNAGLGESSSFACDWVRSVYLDVGITLGDEEEAVGRVGTIAVAGGDDGGSFVHALYFRLCGGEEEGRGCDLQGWEGDVFALHVEFWRLG